MRRFAQPPRRFRTDDQFGRSICGFQLARVPPAASSLAEHPQVGSGGRKPDHGIDTTAATHSTAARPSDRPGGKLVVGFRLEAPIFRRTELIQPSRRAPKVDGRCLARWRFQQRDMDPEFPGQTGSEHTSGRAGADDDQLRAAHALVRSREAVEGRWSIFRLSIRIRLS